MILYPPPTTLRTWSILKTLNTPPGRIGAILLARGVTVALAPARSIIVGLDLVIRGVIALPAGATWRRDSAYSAAGVRRRRRGPACGPARVVEVEFKDQVTSFWWVCAAPGAGLGRSVQARGRLHPSSRRIRVFTYPWILQTLHHGLRPRG